MSFLSFCCQSESKLIYSDHLININECHICKSLFIKHKLLDSYPNKNDYYENQFYKLNEVEHSLKKSRLRQAVKIISTFENYISKNDLIIDYGCGYCHFINSAKDKGFPLGIVSFLIRLNTSSPTKILPEASALLNVSFLDETSTI